MFDKRVCKICIGESMDKLRLGDCCGDSLRRDESVSRLAGHRGGKTAEGIRDDVCFAGVV